MKMAEMALDKRVKLLAVSYYSTLLIGALIGMVLLIENAMLVSWGVIALLMVGISSMYHYLGMASIERDERAARIGMKAMSMSMTVVLITISLALITEGSAWVEIGGYRILGLVLIAMMVTLFVSNSYYRRRGDVE